LLLLLSKKLDIFFAPAPKASPKALGCQKSKIAPTPSAPSAKPSPKAQAWQAIEEKRRRCEKRKRVFDKPTVF
jgi:hypothetical protein